MNIEEILKQLEDSIKEPVLIGGDYYTGEGWETPNFFCLDPTTNDCKVLYEYITKLQNNWNELSMWAESCINELKENDVYDRTSYEQGQIIALESFIAKIQELEGENNNEEESNSK